MGNLCCSDNEGDKEPYAPIKQDVLMETLINHILVKQKYENNIENTKNNAKNIF